MPLKLTNNATSTLTASITSTSSTLSIEVADSGKFPVIGQDDWHPLTVVDTAGNMEVMRVTARAGAILTVSRGQEGTVAKAFSAGSRVDVRLTAGSLVDGFASLGADGKVPSGQMTNIVTKENVGAAQAGATEKTAPPADPDRLVGVEAGNSNLFWITFGKLKEYFDELYPRINSLGNSAKLNVGTEENTVAAGDDERLSDAREWIAEIVSQAEAEAGNATAARKWTAQRVRQAINALAPIPNFAAGNAALSAGSIGSLMLAMRSSNTATAFGTVVAGSDLRPINTAAYEPSGAQSGSWRCLGKTTNAVADSYRTTLWMRIS